MSSIIEKTFEGKLIRAVTDEHGNVLFVGKDVAEALGYSDTSDAVKRHCKGSVKRLPLQTAGGVQDVRVLTQADVLRLVVSSRLPEAQKFEAWVFEVVLPEIAETGSYGKRKPTTYTEVPGPAVEAIQVAEAISNYLKLEGSARLHMLEQAVKLKAPSFLPMVPAYAIDAPRTADGKLIGDVGSSSSAFSATDLLRKLGSPVSAVKFNNLAVTYGLLILQERSSTKYAGINRQYKVIPNEYLCYGKNLVSSSNQRETQPYWFEETFQEVLEKIGVTK